MSRIKIFEYTDANGKQNQDSSVAIRQGDRAVLCIADGVGGLEMGEIASGYATKYVELWSNEKDANQMGIKTTRRELSDLIFRLHEDLLAICKERDVRLASTFIIGIIGLKKAVIASVGDSRVYILQDGKCSQATKDQTVDVYEAETGETLNIAGSKSSTLTQWLGFGNKNLEPSFYEIDLNEKVDILLCTDGLSNTLKETEILSELRKRQPGDESLRNLARDAKERGETDNISAVLYRRRPDRKPKKKKK